MLGNRKTVLLVANQDGLAQSVDAVKTGDGFLKHRLVTDERQQLFGIFFTGQGPQAGA